MLAGHAREKLTAQVRDAAERISSSVATVLGIAIIAVILSAAALLVSVRCLKAVSA